MWSETLSPTAKQERDTARDKAVASLRAMGRLDSEWWRM